ncbi:TlpA disulfide reductase family protein [Maribacter sp. SA7]|uniref:TlpA family protein disulfide reductase n=1 Tax=Maribacter zhoushanensis TaxID=3030012 RepID=UPI0023EBA907|nr:TlpA disulfide reductase family protein [Maribacter zhoushanensis]MDF4203103.1 TlpA disulfide reductase family protein [Maribacter zhoushanensis]
MSTTPLKIITSLILLVLSLTACNSPAAISGTLTGLDKENTKIYLIQPEDLQHVAASYLGKVIDSAIVNADGSFEFHNLPNTKESVLLELAVQPTGKVGNYLQINDPIQANYMPIVWQSGEPIQISARFDEFQKSFTLENPSDLNSALLAVRDIKAEAYQTFLANQHWNVEDGGELMAKEHASLRYKTALIEFADSTPYLLPALVALRWVSPENDYERVPEFLVNQCTKWKENEADHPWVKQLCEKSEPTNLPVLIGDKFPNTQLPLLSKDTVYIKDVLGKKLTIIDLWASWCAPCRLENRKVLVPLYNEYHEQGLQIVAYALESDEAAWKTATKRDGADRWLQSSDLQGDDAPFLKKIRVRTIPANFILDSNGVVIAKNLHGQDLINLVRSSFEK